MLGDSINDAMNSVGPMISSDHEDSIEKFREALASAIFDFVESVSERREEWRTHVIQEMFSVAFETSIASYEFAEKLETLKGE